MIFQLWKTWVVGGGWARGPQGLPFPRCPLLGHFRLKGSYGHHLQANKKTGKKEKGNQNKMKLCL
jgi:hypothetical protein